MHVMLHDSQILLAAAGITGTIVVVGQHLLAAIRVGKLIFREIFPILKNV
jgi:hypothetical protein